MIRDRLRIGITQRRVADSPEALARDALDANWSDWLASCWPGSQFLAIPNFSDPCLAVRHVVQWEVDLLIFSGGEDVGASPVRDAVERCLLDHARVEAKPVIGVCRGMQVLHSNDGGKLLPRSEHVGSPHLLLGVEPAGACVNSWHRWCVEQTAPHWRVLARALDGSVEAMQHEKLPWLGFMWHPERPGGTLPAMWDWIRENIANTRRHA